MLGPLAKSTVTDIMSSLRWQWEGKLKILICIVCLIFFSVVLAAAGINEMGITPPKGYAPGVPVEEVDGSHPFWINERKTPVQGHIYRVGYTHDIGSPPLPSFEIIAHFVEAIKSRGGVILYENPRNFLHARFEADGNECMVEIFADKSGEEFRMTLVRLPAAQADTDGTRGLAVLPLTSPSPIRTIETSVSGIEINPSLLPCPPAYRAGLSFNVSFPNLAGKPALRQTKSYVPETDWLNKYQPTTQSPKLQLDSFTASTPNCRQ